LKNGDILGTIVSGRVEILEAGKLNMYIAQDIALLWEYEKL